MSAQMPVFRMLSARQQIALLRQYPKLMPRLLHWGLSAQDAQALAWNAALLFTAMQADPPFASPAEVFERYSLDDIAALCTQYHQKAGGTEQYEQGGGAR